MIEVDASQSNVDRIKTGVPGLDEILGGGLPTGFVVLLGGGPGAGKTTLACQIAFHFAEQGGRALILSTLSSPNTKLIAHLRGFRFFRDGLMGENLQMLNVREVIAREGLAPAIGRIRTAVLERNIKFLVLDSVSGLYPLARDGEDVKRFILDLGSAMYLLGCTLLVVDDRFAPGGELTPEQNLSDGLIYLDVPSAGRGETRRARVLKLRACRPMLGYHSYEIKSDGIRVYPRVETLSVAEETPVTGERLKWGVLGLDALTGGGVPIQDSTLVLGPAGMGKTTLGLHFVAEAVSQAQPCLHVSFHETAEELLYKAAMAGINLRPAVDSGMLRIMYIAPAGADADRIAHEILADVEARSVSRLVIDTINVLEHDAVREGRFTDFLSALTRLLRQKRVTSVMIRVMAQLAGAESEIATSRESYWMPMDNILLMRPVESAGGLGKIVSVLKMRYSGHDSRIHSYTFSERGLEIGGVVAGLQGLLTGLPRNPG